MGAHTGPNVTLAVLPHETPPYFTPKSFYACVILGYHPSLSHLYYGVLNKETDMRTVIDRNKAETILWYPAFVHALG